MDLREMNYKLEELENAETYWINELELASLLVSVGSPAFDKDKVDGGIHGDAMLRYAMIEDEKKIRDTLKYIAERKKNLILWMKRELEIMGKYGKIEELIVQYKELGEYDESIKGYRKLKWEEISNKVHWSKTFCRNVYRNHTKMRKSENQTL